MSPAGGPPIVVAEHREHRNLNPMQKFGSDLDFLNAAPVRNVTSDHQQVRLGLERDRLADEVGRDSSANVEIAYGGDANIECHDLLREVEAETGGDQLPSPDFLHSKPSAGSDIRSFTSVD